MARRRLQLLTLGALALVCVGILAGCGKSSNKQGETVREGLSTPLGGLRYTVFLTRMLNLKNDEDMGYVPGQKEAPPGKALYGVFLEACNKSKDNDYRAATSFYIEDAQGEKFEPEHLSQQNPYAYQGGIIPAENCDPRRGSLAQQGPTSGSMLLFQLPLAATENRPLELHIEGPAGDGATGQAEQATVILDI